MSTALESPTVQQAQRVLGSLLRHGADTLRTALDAEALAALPAALDPGLAALATAAPAFQQAGNRQSFHYVLPTAVLYLHMRELLGSEEALGLCRAVVEAEVRDSMGSNPLLPLIRSIPGLPRLVAWFACRTMRGLDEPGGWRAAPPVPPGLGYDVVHCAAHAFLDAQGIPELTPLFCGLDLLGAELLGQRLSRTGTLAEGAARCDFRYFAG